MTRMSSLGAAMAGVVAGLVLAAAPCSAEWFADIYVGATRIANEDPRINDRSAGPGTFRDVEFDTGYVIGGRFGAYFDAVPFLGLAVDYSSASSYIGPQTVRVDGCSLLGGCGVNRVPTGSFEVEQKALSLDIMLRLPIGATKEAPWGVVQPYIGAGVPLVITSITPHNTRLFRNHDGDTDLSFGYKGEVGVAVSVYKNLMVFGEYRFMHTEAEFEMGSYAPGTRTRSTLRTDLDTHSAVVGLSARW
jgi:opacity protein-like surface antigen